MSDLTFREFQAMNRRRCEGGFGHEFARMAHGDHLAQFKADQLDAWERRLAQFSNRSDSTGYVGRPIGTRFERSTIFITASCRLNPGARRRDVR